MKTKILAAAIVTGLGVSNGWAQAMFVRRPIPRVEVASDSPQADSAADHKMHMALSLEEPAAGEGKDVGYLTFEGGKKTGDSWKYEGFKHSPLEKLDEESSKKLLRFVNPKEPDLKKYTKEELAIAKELAFLTATLIATAERIQDLQNRMLVERERRRLERMLELKKKLEAAKEQLGEGVDRASRKCGEKAAEKVKCGPVHPR